MYHENVCMSEALTVHRVRVEELERKTQQLEMTNRCSMLETVCTIYSGVCPPDN